MEENNHLGPAPERPATGAPAARRWAAPVAAVLAACAVAGCSGAPAGGSNQPGVPGPAGVAPGPAADPKRTPISSTSVQDLSAALRANDVDDPDKWAQILVEFRPYPPGQPGQDKLRQVLQRFQADPDTTGKITSAVST